MNNLEVLTEENGFTLIESIIAVILVSLTISGLFLAWYVMETRDRSLQQYWQSKETLELAYQITHQTLRAKAKRIPAITTINSGQGISFEGIDGKTWAFTKDGNNYLLDHDGRVEIIIADICNYTLFVLDGTKVDITLGVMPSANWTGLDDLNINGKVFIRNYP
jgi:prepilin-type N-terminal cleavage/methylation domain-containing protein